MENKMRKLILIFGMLVAGIAAQCQQMQIDSVWKDLNGVWRGSVSGPLSAYPASNLVVKDTSNIPDPIVIVVPPDTIPDPPDPQPTPKFDYVVTNNMELVSAMNSAQTGDTVALRAGTYRMTVVPLRNGVTFINYPKEIAVISGLEPIASSWSVHSGNIYKTNTILPVNGFNQNLTSNTTILANQIFKDGVMQFQARWPKVNSVEDLIDRTKWRHHSQTSGGIGYSQLTDNGLPSGNFNGAAIWVSGWFISESRTGVKHSGKTLEYPTLRAQNGNKFQKWYYITNDLELLTQAKEWHYENSTLYFWQEGGGVPTNIEYKARNWGFDLRGKDNTKIVGLYFTGCEPATGDTNTDGTIIDNIRAQYNNHAFLTTTGGDYNYFNAKQTGMKLLGSNNVVKNSEFKYVSSQVIWAHNGTVVENNLCHDIGWEGNYGAFVTPWEGTNNNIKILRNTAYRLGRSAVDFGHGTHTNMDIGYNDFHTFSMVTSDVGVIYGCCAVNITGTRIHHNWLHDNMVKDGWSGPQGGANYDGTHANLYFDQAAGPSTVDHNVMWNGGVQDLYSQVHGVTNKIYNNTFASENSWIRESYLCASPVGQVQDPQRNNIYRDLVNIVWNYATSNDNANQPGDVSNSIFNTQDPQFVRAGNGGLQYRLKSTSPALNMGVAIPGITDGSVGLPDAGAYEYGSTDWVPGYNATSTAPIPPPTTKLIQAESGQLTGASIKNGDKVCCIQPLGKLKYTGVNSTGSVTIRYARGNADTGSLSMKIGNGSETVLNFNSTSTTNWDTYIEATFNVPVGSGDLEFNNGSVMGPADIDWIRFNEN